LKKQFIAKVVAGNRITIPNEVCQVLGIEHGIFVEVDLDVVAALPKIEDNLGGGQ
jgi:bifunctional DNA-binding transcriptional regulator/antitoxin component of YhaV-PrlF toxin-antitoxin module